MRREYGREKYKLQYQGKTLTRDLKKKVDKKQSKVILLSIIAIAKDGRATDSEE